MGKRIIVIFCLFTTIYCFSESEITINFLDGTVKKVNVDDDVDEIYGYKMYLQFKKEGQSVTKINYTSKIINIDGITKLEKLKKIEFSMAFYNFRNFSAFEVQSLEEIIVSSGLMESCFLTISKLENLNSVYLISNMDIKEIQSIDFTKTKLEYIEISNSKLQKIENCQFPITMKYLNVRMNGNVYFDERTIAQINSNGITVIADEYINGIQKQIVGSDYYKKVPDKYQKF